MQSKVHPTYKTKYRIANWPAHDVGPRTQCISGLNYAAYGLPVNASRPGSPQAHASLGSGWRPTLAGWDWIPTGFRTRFRRSHHVLLSPLTGLSRHTRCCMKDLLRVGRFGPPFSSPQEPHCNRALVHRGDVTVWVSSEAITAWTPRRSGQRGGQRRYSDLAIETALTLRLLYHLPLRQAEGFLHALFGIMRLDLSVPDSTTLSRRSQHLRRCLRPVPPGEGLHLVLDSTGLSIVGAGEWAAATHGGRGRRGWRKLHRGVEQSGVIRVHTLTEATGEDATTALDLLTAVDGPLVRVTADAASDTVAVYETATARGAKSSSHRPKRRTYLATARGRPRGIGRSRW